MWVCLAVALSLPFREDRQASTKKEGEKQKEDGRKTKGRREEEKEEETNKRSSYKFTEEENNNPVYIETITHAPNNQPAKQ